MTVQYWRGVKGGKPEYVSAVVRCILPAHGYTDTYHVEVTGEEQPLLMTADGLEHFSRDWRRLACLPVAPEPYRIR